MNKNIGNTDRAIRLIVGVGIIVAGVMNDSLLSLIHI